MIELENDKHFLNFLCGIIKTSLRKSQCWLKLFKLSCLIKIVKKRFTQTEKKCSFAFVYQTRQLKVVLLSLCLAWGCSFQIFMFQPFSFRLTRSLSDFLCHVFIHLNFSTVVLRISRPEVFWRRGVLRNFSRSSQEDKEKRLAQLFSCEFWEISKNAFYYRVPLVAASVYWDP